MSRSSREVHLTATKGDYEDFQQDCIDYMERSRRGFQVGVTTFSTSNASRW